MSDTSGKPQTILAEDATNFVSWRRDLSYFLQTKRLHLYLQTPIPPQRALYALEEDQQALGHLGMSCSEGIWDLISGARTTVDAIGIIEGEYRRASDGKLVALDRDRSSFAMLVGERLPAYFQRARRLRDDIRAAGGNWPESDMRLRLLMGLRSEYHPAKSTAVGMADRSLLALQRMLEDWESLAPQPGGLGEAGYALTARPSGLGSGGSSSNAVGVAARGLPAAGPWGHSRGGGSAGYQGGSSSGGSNEQCWYCFVQGHQRRNCNVRVLDEKAGIFRANIRVPPPPGKGQPGGGGSGGSKGPGGGKGRGRGGKGGGSGKPFTGRGTVLAVQDGGEGAAEGSSDDDPNCNCADASGDMFGGSSCSVANDGTHHWGVGQAHDSGSSSSTAGYSHAHAGGGSSSSSVSAGLGCAGGCERVGCCGVSGDSTLHLPNSGGSSSVVPGRADGCSAAGVRMPLLPGYSRTDDDGDGSSNSSSRSGGSAACCFTGFPGLGFRRLFKSRYSRDSRGSSCSSSSSAEPASAGGCDVAEDSNGGACYSHTLPPNTSSSSSSSSSRSCRTGFCAPTADGAGDGAATTYQLLVDSGAFRHITAHRHLLSNYTPSRVKMVRWGDGHIGAVQGEGMMSMLSGGQLLHVHNVLHVPTSELSLLSVIALTSNGSKVVFEGDGVQVVRGRRLLLQGRNRNGQYILSNLRLLSTSTEVPIMAPATASTAESSGSSTSNGTSTAAPAGGGGGNGRFAAPTGGGDNSSGAAAPTGGGETDSSAATQEVAGSSSSSRSSSGLSAQVQAALRLHRRLGHLGFSSIKRMVSQGMVTGADVSLSAVRDAAELVCSKCMEAKAASAAFPRSSSGATTVPLQLAHSDVCGPFPHQGRGGAQYYITLLDDATGYGLVRILQQRGQAYTALQEMVAEMESLYPGGSRLRTLRSDNGGEYVSLQLEQWLRSRGTVHQYSAPYTPQQNGAAERVNRTLQDRCRALLLEADLPNGLWPDAVSYAAYIRNLSPSAGRNVTPYEAFTGKKPDVSSLRTFGCRVFVMVPAEQRDKLGARANVGTYLGPERNTAASRVKVGNGMVVSRDLKWDEAIRGPASRRAGTQFGDGVGDSSSNDAAHAAAAPAPGVPAQQTQMGPPPHPSPPSRPATRSQHPNLLPPINPVTAAASAVAGGGSSSSTATAAAAATESDDEEVPPLAPMSDDEDYEPAGCSSATAAVAEPFPGEPQSYEQAQRARDADKWLEAMQEEMASQRENGTWVVEPLPPGTRVLANRWVFKLKPGDETQPPRYKARLVAKGFQQREGIDYDEVFAPTTCSVSLRTLLALAAEQGLLLEQLDVKTAFLNGQLDEELWMQLPQGFEEETASSGNGGAGGDGTEMASNGSGGSSCSARAAQECAGCSKNSSTSVSGNEGGRGGEPIMACRLLKSIYGLKQAPRCWYIKLCEQMGGLGFTPSAADAALFVRHDAEGPVYVLVHVDDMLIAAGSAQQMATVKAAINGCFKVRELGEARVYLGMRIIRRPDGKEIKLSQRAYIEDLLQRHGMVDAKPRSLPLPPGTRVLAAALKDLVLSDSKQYSALVGEMNYLATNTRPDIAFALSLLPVGHA